MVGRTSDSAVRSWRAFGADDGVWVRGRASMDRGMRWDLRGQWSHYLKEFLELHVPELGRSFSREAQEGAVGSAEGRRGVCVKTQNAPSLSIGLTLTLHFTPLSPLTRGPKRAAGMEGTAPAAFRWVCGTNTGATEAVFAAFGARKWSVLVQYGYGSPGSSHPGAWAPRKSC